MSRHAGRRRPSASPWWRSWPPPPRPRPGARAGAASGSGPAHDALWAHREQAARAGLRASASRARDTSFAVGQIAVLLDEGDLALLRNDLDLVNESLRFEPVPGGYRVVRGGATLVTDPGTPVPLGDDDSREVALPFAFPFYGRSFDRVFVNSDGNLTFGEADPASTPRRVGRLVNGPPRIAPLLTDLDPSAGGAASVQALGDRFVVSWREIPNFESPLPNTMQAVLYADGRVEFIYGTLNGNADEGVTGIAPGAGRGRRAGRGLQERERASRAGAPWPRASGPKTPSTRSRWPASTSSPSPTRSTSSWCSRTAAWSARAPWPTSRG